MNRKVKEVRRGIRLNIKKPPKVETPRNVYRRKAKHKKSHADEERMALSFREFILDKCFLKSWDFRWTGVKSRKGVRSFLEGV